MSIIYYKNVHSFKDLINFREFYIPKNPCGNPEFNLTRARFLHHNLTAPNLTSTSRADSSHRWDWSISYSLPRPWVYTIGQSPMGGCGTGQGKDAGGLLGGGAAGIGSYWQSWKDVLHLCYGFPTTRGCNGGSREELVMKQRKGYYTVTRGSVAWSRLGWGHELVWEGSSQD